MQNSALGEVGAALTHNHKTAAAFATPENAVLGNAAMGPTHLTPGSPNLPVLWGASWTSLFFLSSLFFFCLEVLL